MRANRAKTHATDGTAHEDRVGNGGGPATLLFPHPCGTDVVGVLPHDGGEVLVAVSFEPAAEIVLTDAATGKRVKLDLTSCLSALRAQNPAGGHASARR